jgi:hypothetical protein
MVEWLTPVLVIAALATLQCLRSVTRRPEQSLQAVLPTVTPSAWTFVAMEYCYGMLNRTYLVFVSDRLLCAAKVRGPMAAPAIVTERFMDPYFYPNPSAVQKLSHVEIDAPAFLKLNSANFQLPHHSIAR